MRAAGVMDTGGRLEMLDLPSPPTPTGGDVLIVVHAAGVGNWDELMRTGSWPSGLSGPHALGVEVAGTVLTPGPDVTSLRSGQKVAGFGFPFRDGGGWAQYQLVASTDLARTPETLSWRNAATLPVPGLTAFQTLTDALSVQRGERLFVHGAAGVTGGLLVQLAVLRGLHVVATAGERNTARLLGYGASTVVDRTRYDWRNQVLHALGGPADVAVNAVPGGADAALGLVADGGRFASIAGPFQDRPYVSASEVFVRPDGRQLHGLLNLLDRGDIRVPIEGGFQLEHAAEALDQVRAGSHGSAISLAIAEEPAVARVL